MLDTAKLLIRGNPHAFEEWYVGLTPEEQSWLGAALGFDAARRALEAMREVWEPIREALVEFAQVVIEWIRMVCLPWFRLMLYHDLRRWYVPCWLARCLAWHWPRGWLLR